MKMRPVVILRKIVKGMLNSDRNCWINIDQISAGVIHANLLYKYENSLVVFFDKLYEGKG